MIDNIAPLISIIMKIFVDIVGFIIILVIFMFTFSFAFFLLAQNQKNFDNLSEEDEDAIPYLKFYDSLAYIGNMIVGETD